MTIAAPGGELVRLANLAMLSEERGPAQIDHYNRQRKVTLVANLDGIAARHRRRPRADSSSPSSSMPPTYGIVFAGRAKSLGETGTNFLLAFLLSFLFMYMILAAQFESFVHPITILLALPLTIPFALLVALAARRDAQHLQRPRPLHAVRHRQEERHPADRLHQHAARAGAWRATPRSCRPITSACARS